LSCSGETLDAPSSPDPSGGLTAAAGPPGLARALAAQERHTRALMVNPDVVGTAVGLGPDGKAVVKIFLARPGVAGLPSRLDDVPVAVEVTGRFYAGSDPTTRQRPAPVGFSIGHPDITAGTLGARVKDGSGNLYILSNNHVIANSNNASIGDPTLQPGSFDGGTSADSLAWLFDFQPINFSGGNNTIDAGIARTVSANVSASTPTDDAYGAPSSQIFGDGDSDGDIDNIGSVLGLDVMKYGRTTGFTAHEVTEINVTASVCYATRGPFICAQSATFVDQIAIGSADFSAGGDSGSLIVSQSGKNPVGLLFAGSSTRTIANRIDHVLNRFDVTVDDGSGGGGGGGNNPPTASFTFNCTDLSCSFDGSGSSDPDGTIQSYAWTFGDGDTGSGATVNHTYAGGGTYTVTLTVTDDDNAQDSDSQSVTVSSSGGGGGTTMHVGDLDGASANNGSTWTANITITVHDEGHGALSSATVSGSWSNGTTGNASCVTNGGGTCTVSKTGIPKRTGTVQFTVGNLTHASLTYASGSNHDPDGSSNGTSVTVSKP
jgi:PKD repeat protein